MNGHSYFWYVAAASLAGVAITDLVMVAVLYGRARRADRVLVARAPLLFEVRRRETQPAMPVLSEDDKRLDTPEEGLFI